VLGGEQIELRGNGSTGKQIKKPARQHAAFELFNAVADEIAMTSGAFVAVQPFAALLAHLTASHWFKAIAMTHAVTAATKCS